MSVSEKLTALVAELETKFKKTDCVRFSTCNTTAFGWDPERHQAMCILASRCKRNWRISHSVSYQVDDWTVVDLDQVEKALQEI